MRMLSFYTNILGLWLLVSMGLSCVKRQGSVQQSEVKVLEDGEAQELIREDLETRLKSWFQREGKRIDTVTFEKSIEKILDPKYVKDREKVLEAILTHSIKGTSDFTLTNQAELRGEGLSPGIVIEAVQNSWVVKYIPKRNAQTKSIEMTTIKYSHIPSKMGMMPNEVIPFLTRYITKMIRGKNPRSAGDVISQRLKATPVNQGALRNVVFHPEFLDYKLTPLYLWIIFQKNEAVTPTRNRKTSALLV